MESRYLQNLSLKEGHVVCYGGPVVLKHDYFSNECSVNMSNTYIEQYWILYGYLYVF